MIVFFFKRSLTSNPRISFETPSLYCGSISTLWPVAVLSHTTKTLNLVVWLFLLVADFQPTCGK